MSLIESFNILKKPKKEKSNSPVDLSENFKLVKTRRNNKTRMRIMAGILIMFLVTVLLSTFAISKSKGSINYQEEFVGGENENIAPQYGEMADVNQIVERKRKDNLLQNSNDQTPPPTSMKDVPEVKINIPKPQPTYQEEERAYYVDEQKLGEFFSSKKQAQSSDEQQVTVSKQSKKVQSYKPKNPPAPKAQVQETHEVPETSAPTTEVAPETNTQPTQYIF